MSANLIIFEGQYMADQIRNMDKVKQLTEDAMEIIKKANQHRNWKCKETADINNSLDTISSSVKRLHSGIMRTAIALGDGLRAFHELEQRSESQANTLSSNLKNNYGFDATDRNTGNNAIVATTIIPAIQGGKITVCVLQTWFKQIQEKIREFWENFIKRNKDTHTQIPTSIPKSGHNDDTDVLKESNPPVAEKEVQTPEHESEYKIENTSGYANGNEPDFSSEYYNKYVRATQYFAANSQYNSDNVQHMNCVYYARARAMEVNGLEECPVFPDSGTSTHIRENSVAWYHKPDGGRHAVYVENVQYDESGNPQRVWFSDSNMKGQNDGTLHEMSYDDFLSYEGRGWTVANYDYF